jgi:hypothetical protein
MKYLKKFETKHRLPEVGDYVIITDLILREKEQNKIGKITHRYDNSYSFYNSPFYDVILNGEERFFGLENIQDWSDNKEELEIILNINKYNL